MSLDLPDKGRKRWTMCWKAPLNAFQITLEGRLTQKRPFARTGSVLYGTHPT
ncbi:hypothetical protein SCOCK_50155 [Actinacidiphila cocklensis]|uniref:Uncharacterized protein n=1 Tax=Actinacidiphila cocklensis TaxID=887465 RepID=A0A9W4GTJ6_9ACTN|nr:hypothetical protein SCOCK_50155 [Actinacidiphila cocklensis]